MLLFLFLLLAVFSLLIFYNFVWKRRRLPPGPPPLPVLGNVLHLAPENQYKIFQQWSAEYGPVYTIWVGEQPVVIVTDFELIKASFIKDGDSYTDRAFFKEHFLAFHGSVDGVIRSDGELWRQMRKFLFKSMRDYGIEEEGVEEMVLDSIFVVIDELKTEKALGEQRHSVDRKVDLMTGSIINKMMFSFGFYGESQKEFAKLKELLDLTQVYFASLPAIMIEASPWLRHWPYFSAKFQHAKSFTQQLIAYGEREMERRIEARKMANPSDHWGRDILDQFLDQIDETDQNDPDNFYKTKYLPTFLFDIFLAGQETTSNTINWLCLYLMLDQLVQERLHAELDQVMAEKKAQDPSENSALRFHLADRPKLHFTNAVTNETQRLCNLLPINLTRSVNRDVEIGGRKLQKGAQIIPQISTVLYDEKIFPEPHKFLPDRFLDERGHFKRVEEFVPFSIGKRICPGEALSRMELLLFTANFFHKFHVYPVDPLNPPKAKRRPTFAAKLDAYECRIEMRN